MHTGFCWRETEWARIRHYTCIQTFRHRLTYFIIIARIKDQIIYHFTGRTLSGITDAIDKFIEDEVKLLITFDLGITAVKEVAHAQASGVDVIITKVENE